MDCRPTTFSGTEGAVGLLHWFEKLESVFEMCECLEARRVKYATGTLEGIALTWWKAQVQMLGLAVANTTPWNDFKELIKEEYCNRDDIHKLEVEFFNLKMTGSEFEAYTKRSNELAILCPTMVDPPIKHIELSSVWLIVSLIRQSSRTGCPSVLELLLLLPLLLLMPPTTTSVNGMGSQARVQHQLSLSLSSERLTTTGALVSNLLEVKGRVGTRGTTPSVIVVVSIIADRVLGAHVRGVTNHAMPRSLYPANQRRQNQQQAPQNQRQQQQQQQDNNKGCFQCGAEGHFKRDCPQLNQRQNNNQGNGNNNRGNNGDNSARGRVFVIGLGDARNDPNVVMVLHEIGWPLLSIVRVSQAWDAIIC
ncbi:putative transcription factor interactor and regulator CCHC(Zn) family [Helianthus annuus]|nr:putative transcription factor interactor and regulator CCHC(Zn) family [Helianthus annuus]KAJ0756637.1 putative transcription factor interactor and regulator CCHC(Zn) family [Helianthus annuus]